MEKTASPIEAIIAQFTAELGFASTLDRFADGQEFLLMDFRYKEIYDNYRISFEHRHQQIVTLLQKALTSGELKNIDDIYNATSWLRSSPIVIKRRTIKCKSMTYISRKV